VSLKKTVVVVSIIILVQLLFLFIIIHTIKECVQPDIVNVYQIFPSKSNCSLDDIANQELMVEAQEAGDEIYYQVLNKKRESNGKKDIRTISTGDTGK
jgi:hypothetical protein